MRYEGLRDGEGFDDPVVVRERLDARGFVRLLAANFAKAEVLALHASKVSRRGTKQTMGDTRPSVARRATPPATLEAPAVA